PSRGQRPAWSHGLDTRWTAGPRQRHDEVSWAEGVAKELGQLGLPPFDEARELEVIHPEDHREHGPRGEWKDAEGNDVRHELLDGNRPHRSRPNVLFDLVAELSERARQFLAGLRTGGCRQKRRKAFGVVVHLGEEVPRQE